MSGLTACKTKTLTYKDLPEASSQQVFDHVVTHLFTQRTRAYDGKYCVMLDESGNRCAVGSLIPVEEILSHVEEGEVDLASSWNRWCYSLGINIDDHWHLLRELQTAHDASPTSSDDLWLLFLYKRFLQTAKLFNLSSAVVESYKNVVIAGPYQSCISS